MPAVIYKMGNSGGKNIGFVDYAQFGGRIFYVDICIVLYYHDDETTGRPNRRKAKTSKEEYNNALQVY